MNPGVVGLVACESLFSHLEVEEAVAEKYLARLFSNIQEALGGCDFENAYWLPGAENSADGLTRVRSDMVPLLRLLDSGRFCLGRLRALKGVAWQERVVHVAHSSSGACALPELDGFVLGGLKK